jgi:hypothetical protein
LVGLVARGAAALVAGGAAALVARFAGAAPLAAFAADRLAGEDAAFAAPRFTGSTVAGLALVAATYTPSVGLTFGGFGHG